MDSFESLEHDIGRHCFSRILFEANNWMCSQANEQKDRKIRSKIVDLILFRWPVLLAHIVQSFFYLVAIVLWIVMVLAWICPYIYDGTQYFRDKLLPLSDGKWNVQFQNRFKNEKIFTRNPFCAWNSGPFVKYNNGNGDGGNSRSIKWQR